MKYLKLCTSLLVGFCLSGGIFAESSNTLHYRVNFDNGNTYEVLITPESLIWKGLTGEEAGQQQTIKNYRHTQLTDNVIIYQWVGLTGNFNTTAVDKKKLKIVSSGTDHKEAWLWNGILEKLSTT